MGETLSQLPFWCIQKLTWHHVGRRTENKQCVEVELSGQVQRAQQILLSASDNCVERARRHFRNVLGVFSDLILNGEASDKTRAARYLRLQQHIHQNHARQKGSVATLEERN
jgi:hypothetical protein